MIMTAPHPSTGTQTRSSQTNGGGRLVSADGRALPLRHVHLAAEAAGGIARVTLTQTFFNPHDEPLEVRYLLPLPSDGAVSGFSFTLADQRVSGEVTGKQVARQRFERAVASGRTAALLEEDRSSLFTQRVGNVPPRSEIVAEVIVDQPLRWLEEGCWEWRFPTVVGPRYQGQAGRVQDAAKLSVPVADAPLSVGATLTLSIGDDLTGSATSPSHAIQTRNRVRPTSPLEVSLEGEGKARLDRDVVIRWPVALPSVSAKVHAARPATAAHDGDQFALLTVAPPTGGGVALARDLTFLIDTSGSMGGRPLEQAARVVEAMIETLGVNDRIELIEFGSSPKRWQRKPVRATEANKEAAIAWTRNLRASGCTEMHRAVLEALRPLRKGSQRQVILVTDGYIGFEQEIVSTLVRDMPAGARLHTIGVGSSVNRTLTEGAARAGRGVELIIGIDEDPSATVHRLLARTTAPLVTDLVLEGEGLVEVSPRALPDLYAESPALIAARLAPGGGELVLRGQTAEGPYEQRFTIPAQQPGEGPCVVANLFGREKVKDLETSLSGGASQREVDRTIEDTGIEFQIATRLTSWVAVSEEITVQPGTTLRTVDQPHELPHGVSAEGLGLRAPRAPGAPGLAMPALRDVTVAKRPMAPPRLSRRRSSFSAPVPPPPSAAPSEEELELDWEGDAPTLSVESGFGGARFDDGDDDERAQTGEFVLDDRFGDDEDDGLIPTVEVPSISADMGLIETESDAALVEVGSDESMEYEAFELMDEGEEEPDGAPKSLGITTKRSLPASSPRRAGKQAQPRSSRLPWLILLAIVALALILWAASSAFGAVPSHQNSLKSGDGRTRPTVPAVPKQPRFPASGVGSPR